MPDKNSGGGGPDTPPPGLSYVVCGDPLLKAEFLAGLAGRCGGGGGRGGTVYIDLDMMYGGFLRAGVLGEGGGAPPGGLLHIRAGNGEEARLALGRAVASVSGAPPGVGAGAGTEGPATVIIDTLNGMYGVAGGSRGGEERADAAIMMLAMAARHTSSRVVVACIAEHREGRGWRLLPGGKKLPVAGAGAGEGAAWLRIVQGDRSGGGAGGGRGSPTLEAIAPGGRGRGADGGGAWPLHAAGPPAGGVHQTAL